MLCSVVVPCYNEEAVLAEAYKRLTAVMEGCGADYELLFVNDGSRDGTLPALRALHERDRRVKVLSLARNFGHQIAVTAGLDRAGGDAVVVIDADLQDPPSVIPDMLAQWRAGFEVIYGRRAARRGDSFFKKATAGLFYRALNRLSDIRLPLDAGDFRLLDRKVVDTMKRMPEHNRYLRGLSIWAGFRQTGVDFIREERFAGETKYPFRKMLGLAVNGVISFSYKPLGLPTALGTLVSAGAGIGLAAALALFCLGRPVGASVWLGLASLLVSGATLLMLGVFGAYIARICDEVRGRPLYVVGETLGWDL